MSHPDQLTPPGLWWTPWPGTGPGQEILGDLHGRRILELGCGRGDNAAALAAAGGTVIGVDVAPEKVQDARTRWGRLPRLRFVHAEASHYLATHTERNDIVCSIFGALSFTPAAPLLDLIAARVGPCGLLAISARLRPTGPSSASAGHGPWLDHAKSPEQWSALLDEHGFQVTTSLVLRHPSQRGAAATLVLTANPV